jgi:hypothetical protein
MPDRHSKDASNSAGDELPASGEAGVRSDASTQTASPHRSGSYPFEVIEFGPDDDFTDMYREGDPLPLEED